MGLEQKSIEEIVNGAVKGSFNIPEFQRSFVWRPDQVRDLIESLHRDYPIGAMLVWDASDYDIPRVAGGAQTLQWIVDGQQRTTALCIAFGSKPYWWPDAASWNELIEKLDVLANLETDDGQIEFALANPVRRRDPNWLSVRRVLRCQNSEELTTLALKVAAERGIDVSSTRFAQTLSHINSLWAIRSRMIPIISIKHELEDVAEIFARLNQAGTRVTDADVIVALVAASNQRWVRDEFLPFVTDLDESGYELNTGVYIRAITGIRLGTARLKDVGASFWRDDVTVSWPQVRESISHTVHLLKDRGILSSQLLPSRNSLIPLFAFQARFGATSSFDRAFRWFLLANADGRYSGSATTSLTQDLATIRDAADASAALEQLTSRLRVSPTLDPDRFLEDYSRDRFGRLLLYLVIFDRHAKDWISKIRIGFDKGTSMLNEGFLPEWHHIFPRTILRKAGRSESDINLLANITVLNEKTNRDRLRAKAPAAYVQQFQIQPDELESHLVPNGELLRVERYDDFVMRRAELLADAANAYLQRLGGG